MNHHLFFASTSIFNQYWFDLNLKLELCIREALQ